MKPFFNETTIFTNEELFEFFRTHSVEELEFNHTPEKKPFNNFIRNVYFSTLSLFDKSNGSTGLIDGSRLKNVLLFRYDLIGDYVISTPVVRWLKAMKPDVHIDVVTSARNDFFVKRDPNIHRTFPVPYSRNSLFKMRKAIKAARKTKYDAVIALIFTNMTKAALLAERIAPAADKITIMHRQRSHIYGKVFNRMVEHHCWKEHWCQTMLRMATETIHFEGQAPGNAKNPYIFFYDKDIEKALSVADNFGLRYSLVSDNIIVPHVETLPEREGAPFCIVNKSATDKDRQLSNAGAIAISRALLEKYNDLHVFISGPPQESSDINMIAEYAASPRCTPLLLDLTEFIALASSASFVVSNDTATVHIAAAAGVPVVGLYSMLSKISEWYPYNTRFSLVLSPKHGDLDAIEPGKVIEAVDRLGLEWSKKLSST